MKKYNLLSLVGLCTIMLCSGVLLFACNKKDNNNSSTPPAHQHVGEWVVTTPATCTESGLRTYTCTVCGYTEQTTITALGHQWSQYTTSGLVVNECNGTHTRHCLRPNCDEIESGECIYETQTFAPTCDTQGYNIHKCKICGDEFKHDEVPAKGHNYTESYTSLGKINDKYMHRQVCSHDSKHVQDSECTFTKTKTVVGDCTTNGYDEYTCTKCGYSYQHITHQATGHQYNNSTWKFKGDSNNKYHERKCDNCDYVERQNCQRALSGIIPLTCTQDGGYKVKCATCQHEDTIITTRATDHSLGAYIHTDGTDESNSTHYQKCENKDCNYTTEPEKCEFTDEITPATCTASGKTDRHCQKCQVTYTGNIVGAVGHTYDHVEWKQRTNADGVKEHFRLCSVCGEGEEAYLCSPAEEGQIYVQPDCTNTGLVKQICQTCNKEINSAVVPALGHLYNEDEWQIDPVTGHHKQQCHRAECGYMCDEAHSYIQSNLCDMCKHDGLIYEIVDGHAVVMSDDNVLTAKTIIIAEQYNGADVTEIIDMVDPVTKKKRSFASNHTMQYLILPKSLTKIGAHAFSDCDNLKGVSITSEYPDKQPQLKTIDEYAFESCNALLSVNLPSSVKTLGAGCFRQCTALNEIVLPDGIESIGDLAFEGTRYVKDNTNWNGDVLYISKHLVSVHTSAADTITIKPETLYICSKAFADCNKITKVIIPASVKEFNVDAFIGCTGLQEVEYLGTFKNWIAIKFDNDNASPMSYATKITISGATGAIEIPEGTTAIPAGTFKGSSITSVKIPASVTYIGEEAFENCEQLQTITVDEGCNLTYVGADILKNTPYLRTDSNWTENVLYLGHALIAARSGIASDYTVLEGTVSIAVKAFDGCSLNSIVLPTTLLYIGEGAFANCTLKQAQFKGYNGWFATNRQGAGRSVRQETLKDMSAEAASSLTYWNTGYWRRTI